MRTWLIHLLGGVTEAESIKSREKWQKEWEREIANNVKQSVRILEFRRALKKIAQSEAKAGSAMKLCNIARAELGMELRTMPRAKRVKEASNV